MRSMAHPNVSTYSKNYHIRPSIDKGFQPAINKDEILAVLLQNKEDNVSKLMVKNRSQQIGSEKMVDQLPQRCSARLGAEVT